MYSKYKATKVVNEDGKFDSKLELKHWNRLKELEMEGKIKNLKRQVSYELIPKQYDVNGKFLFRPSTYVADFVFDDLEGKTHVVDSKGFETDIFKLKKKLFYSVYGFEIELLKNCNF